MWYRVLRKFAHISPRNKKIEMAPGEMVDVINRHTAKKLLASGHIGPKEPSHRRNMGQPMSSYKALIRYGFFLTTSHRHSGGRLHLYQMGICLAELGAEVYLVTNRMPRWTVDYPKLPNFKILAGPQNEGLPPDFDVIITDAKGPMAEEARTYLRTHKSTKLITMVFETENWVQKFCPDYAKRIAKDLNRRLLNLSDLLLANSKESRKHMMEWLDNPKKPFNNLAPAVNTYVMEASEKVAKKVPERPYAFWCARQVSYKGQHEVADAIWSLKIPFDLVMLQGSYSGKQDTDLHKMHLLPNCTDAEKFKFMRNAVVVLAPSKFEGYGMIPQEALACGTPCVVYDLPVLRESYGNLLTYVPRGNSAKFTEAVHRVIANEKQEKAKIKVDKMKARYGMAAMKKKIETFPYCAVKRKSVSVMVIAYWGFFPEAVGSVYPHVDEIIIAYGPTGLTRCVKPDGSLELIEKLADPDKKIQFYLRKEWRNKLEMREFITSKVTGNYMLMLDSDEIWTGLGEWLEKGPTFGTPAWCNLWHGGKHWVYDTPQEAGRRWGRRLQPYGSTCPHYRWSFWRPTSWWKQHHTPVDAKGNVLRKTEMNVLEKNPKTMIYHLGHSLPKRIMQAKHDFYIKRDGPCPGRDRRMAAWHKWNGECGDQGDGMIEKVTWNLPDIVKRALKRVKA